MLSKKLVGWGLSSKLNHWTTLVLALSAVLCKTCSILKIIFFLNTKIDVLLMQC